MNTDKDTSAGLASFCMRVADLVVRVRPLHAMVGRLCNDYVVDAPLAVDFEIGATQADINFERDMATEGTEWTDAYLETLAVQRAIANRLPERHRLLVHGAVIEFGGAPICLPLRAVRVSRPIFACGANTWAMPCGR